MKKEDYIELYVVGIPLEMTDEGLKNLFSKGGGEVLRATKLKPRNPDTKTCAGYVACLHSENVSLHKGGVLILGPDTHFLII